MKRMFKERVGKLGSLISLITVTIMLAVYSWSLPGFLASPAGRLFAVVWAVAAIIIFVAHTRRIATRDRRYTRDIVRGRTGRAPQKEGQRVMRPLRG